MSYETIKKYVGVTGDALANIWQTWRAPGTEAPPVGSQNRIPSQTPYPGAGIPVGTSTRAGLGISTGTIILGALAYFLLKGK